MNGFTPLWQKRVCEDNRDHDDGDFYDYDDDYCSDYFISQSIFGWREKGRGERLLEDLLKLLRVWCSVFQTVKAALNKDPEMQEKLKREALKSIALEKVVLPKNYRLPPHRIEK